MLRTIGPVGIERRMLCPISPTPATRRTCSSSTDAANMRPARHPSVLFISSTLLELCHNIPSNLAICVDRTIFSARPQFNVQFHEALLFAPNNSVSIRTVCLVETLSLQVKSQVNLWPIWPRPFYRSTYRGAPTHAVFSPKNATQT
jgi:hypothetical protein